MSDPRRGPITIRVEFPTGVEDAMWVWDSHRDHLLKKEAAGAHNGVVVTGIFDEDLIKKNGELERRLQQYEEQFGVLYDGIVIGPDDDEN